MPSEAGTAKFEEFYGAAAMRIVRHCYALTGNLADSQDIAQEAFVRAWQRWASVRDCDSPEAWVRHVATNLATSRWRRDRTARAAAPELIRQQSVQEISPNTVALVAGLRTLPERQRLVLVLHYLADLPVEQIAADLSCPVGSVKAWLSRGRAALAAVMTEPGIPQRQARARLGAAVSALAVVALVGSAVAIVQHTVGRSTHTVVGPAVSSNSPHSKGSLSHALLPPPGNGPLVLTQQHVSAPSLADVELMMARIGGTTKAEPLPGLPSWAAGQSVIATNPAGGWVISYATALPDVVGGEPKRLATVSTSGTIRPFGPPFRRDVRITGLAVKPNGSAVAVAITHVRESFTQPTVPAQIELIPLPGRSGTIRTWTLGSTLKTMARSLSWAPDGSQLSYIPGSDLTGGGFAPAGVVTLDTAAAGNVAPADSNWPPYVKGQCQIQAGAWQPDTGTYLALEQCNSDVVVVVVDYSTGVQKGAAAQLPGGSNSTYWVAATPCWIQRQAAARSSYPAAASTSTTTAVSAM